MPEVIEERLDLIQNLYDSPGLLFDLRALLERCRDLQRSLQKLSLRCGGPLDLLDILATVKAAREVQQLLSNTAETQPALKRLAEELRDHTELETLLTESIPADAPKQISAHGFIQPSISARLTELHVRFQALEAERDALQSQLQEQYDMSTLRLLVHPTLRFMIEVTPREAAKMDAVPDATLIQTLRGKRRYQLTAWTRLGISIEEAQQAVLQEERDILDGTIQKVLAEGDALISTSQALAKIDVAAALAVTAQELGFTRPQLVSSTLHQDTAIEGGRHPVVEQHLLQQRKRQFTSNDCHFNEQQRMWLMTGPNMGGKSTFLRQNALIILLAQMGSFVPAQRASISIVDRIFTRIGAADNLAQDQSTFMLEMLECAEILRHATPRSLVMMDEIGRGTSTLEGMSIAYAVLCYLHDHTRCRTLFATHYHELTDMLESLPAVACHRTSIVSDGSGGFAYLHQVSPGVSRRSHGIIVAKMAGIPPNVLQMAEQTLRKLESQPATISSAVEPIAPIPAAIEAPKPDKIQETLSALAALDLNTLTPYQALERLQDLQIMARRELPQ